MKVSVIQELYFSINPCYFHPLASQIYIEGSRLQDFCSYSIPAGANPRGWGRGGGGRRWVRVRVRVKFGYFLDHPPTGLGLAPFYFPFILFFIGRFFFLLEQILFPDVNIFSNEKRNRSQVYTSIGGFHVTSSPPCLWTKTKDLLSAVLFSFPNIVRCIIVICVSRDCLQTTHSFNLPPPLNYS